MKENIQRCNDRLLLSKGRMQNLGISIKDLKKVPAVSQGTQAGETRDDVIEIELDQEEGNLQNLVNIPDDEDDIAVKQLLAAQNIDISKAKPTPQNIVTIFSGIPQSTIGRETSQNVEFTTQNIPVTSGVRPQIIAITMQNVPGTSGFYTAKH